MKGMYVKTCIKCQKVVIGGPLVDFYIYFCLSYLYTNTGTAIYFIKTFDNIL